MHGGSYTESKIRAIRIIRSGWLNVYHHGTSSCQIRHGRDEMRGKGMSRVLRKQLFSIEELLEKANKVLEKKLFAPNVDSDSIIELIADCQNSAISMGEQIEKLYGEGTNCVALLEQYCEDLYQLTQSFDNSNKKREIYNSLNKQLKKLRGLMTSELPDRLEVVFFPYKASMWDSLESVYLAAREDENCDAYCVPIPYFDRNADGSLGQMHYEGNDYPDNIEVTDWQKYNLEERRPDVIYIHNPYDEWNLVTCVHPNYFAKNLKQYTDKLVYIPYFVLDEIEPDDQTAIDGMKHFVWTPGVIYADRVILQSDKMKQIYVNEFIKAAKESGFSGDFVNRRKLEEKFLGTGSPKFDKVKNTRKEDLEIPEEWLKIIQKPDGSWKKIIFYNTSIGALLENSEKMIEKIKDVLKTLYENRDEIALLWRPHPLIETTLTAMRPSLWESYKKIRDEYITGGWGIYDDTPDMDRAVILSDAYYGDQSSVVALYQKTGKFGLIQNANIVSEADDEEGIEYNKLNIEIEDAALNGNEIWFMALNFNSLFCLDRSNNKTELAGIFPQESYAAQRLYTSMKRVGKKIYFVPFYAKKIIVYNIEEKKFTSLTIDKQEIGCNLESPLFMGVEEYKHYLFFLPVYSKAIIRLNTLNDELEYIKDWYAQINKYVFNEKDSYFRRQNIIIGDRLYAPFCNANAILELNCDTLQFKVHRLGDTPNGYAGICDGGGTFYLAPRNGEDLICWNPTTNTTEIVEQNDVKESEKKHIYVGVLAHQGKICMFDERYSFIKEENGKILYYQCETGKLAIVDGENLSEYKIGVDYSLVKTGRLIRENKGLLSETKGFGLEFMNYILTKDNEV